MKQQMFMPTDYAAGLEMARGNSKGCFLLKNFGAIFSRVKRHSGGRNEPESKQLDEQTDLFPEQETSAYCTWRRHQQALRQLDPAAALSVP